MRWGCCEWMVPKLLEAGVDARVIDVYVPDRLAWYDNWIAVEPVSLEHNVPNCGYKLRIELMRENLFYATDCATLDGIEAKGYDLYMIEANHTEAEIEARLRAKEAAGEFAYESEAMRNHLSQEQALSWLAENMGPRSKYVFLHQHQERGRPDAQ